MRNKLETRFSQFLLLIGAAFLAAYFIAMLTVTNKTNAGMIYNFSVTFVPFVFWFVIYLLVPFSVSSRPWVVIWTIVMSAAAIVFLVGTFFGMKFDSIWGYIGIGMFTYLAIAPLIWLSEVYSMQRRYTSYSNTYAGAPKTTKVVTHETLHHTTHHHKKHPHTSEHHEAHKGKSKHHTSEHHSEHPHTQAHHKHRKATPSKPKKTVKVHAYKVLGYFRRKPKKT